MQESIQHGCMCECRKHCHLLSWELLYHLAWPWWQKAYKSIVRKKKRNFVTKSLLGQLDFFTCLSLLQSAKCNVWGSGCSHKTRSIVVTHLIWCRDAKTATMVHFSVACYVTTHATVTLFDVFLCIISMFMPCCNGRWIPCSWHTGRIPVITALAMRSVKWMCWHCEKTCYECVPCSCHLRAVTNRSIVQPYAAIFTQSRDKGVLSEILQHVFHVEPV